MARLLNNIPAVATDPVWVTLDGVVGSSEEVGGTLTIDAEALTVIEGAGTSSLRANRGVVAAHGVGTTVSYSAASRGIRWRGAWSAIVQYIQGDAVADSG